jgi:2-polyprenyl-3-methyl-5-hydroxy-6-metoxy-1,4-benzoquinol methylase
MGDVEFHHGQYEETGYYTLKFQQLDQVAQQWGFRWRYLLNTMKRYSSGPRFLDVGAGNGYLVHLARTEFGLVADGLEISELEAAFAREKFQIEFLRCELDEIAKTYDVISSCNVLEHVTDPAGLLGSMNRRLEKDGILLLTTPNPSCIHRRLLGLKKWGMVNPPHHINLFTKQGLREIVSAAGFEVLQYEALSTYIRAVRKLDTQGLLVRRAAFHALRLTNLGADHFIVCRKIAAGSVARTPSSLDA